ncbi:MAG: YbhB/YbcL family Raf kinase inhibitor-like protein [Patescibacteria group bacterium]
MARQPRKTIFFVLIVLIIFATVGLVVYSLRIQQRYQEALRAQIIKDNTMGTLLLTSPVFQHNREIPARYTCQGDEVNPELLIQGTPSGTRSLVLIMDDPDAPVGVWDHWVLWNIAPETTEIAENSTPPGAVVGVNSGGQTRYQGPCPPSGTHRYQFTVYAIMDVLSLAPGSDKQTVLKAITGKVLDQCTLVGLYEKS